MWKRYTHRNVDSTGKSEYMRLSTAENLVGIQSDVLTLHDEVEWLNLRGRNAFYCVSVGIISPFIVLVN